MTEIYLTKMLLNAKSRRVWNDLGSLQNLHRTISRAFPAIENEAHLSHHERKTPRGEFNLLHRLEFDGRSGKAILLVQSCAAAPDWSFLSEDYALGIECKAVHEQYARIADGMFLQFRLRANPTKRIGKSYEYPDETRREAFNEKFRDEKNRRRVALRTDEEKIEWLKRKGAAEAGFRLANLRIKETVENVAASAQSKIKSRRREGEPPMTFGAVTFEGVLEVEDADAFRKSLTSGVGSGKAYGFGLLSVAPVKEN